MAWSVSNRMPFQFTPLTIWTSSTSVPSLKLSSAPRISSSLNAVFLWTVTFSVVARNDRADKFQGSREDRLHLVVGEIGILALVLGELPGVVGYEPESGAIGVENLAAAGRVFGA